MRLNRVWIWRTVVALLLFGSWEAVSGPVIDAFWFSRPSEIVVYLWGIILDGQLASDLKLTFRATVEGYFYGALAGLAMGFVLAQNDTVALVLNPFVLAVYGIPRIALAPIFLLWFGIGLTSKVMMAAMMTFMLVLFNTYEGIRACDLELKNVARVMGSSRLQLFRYVILPNASPWIVAGLRISIPQALVAAVVGEFIASTGGLGFRIMETTSSLDTTGTMTSILILMFIVLLLNLLLDRVERRLFKWRPKETSSQNSG